MSFLEGNSDQSKKIITLFTLEKVSPLKDKIPNIILQILGRIRMGKDIKNVSHPKYINFLEYEIESDSDDIPVSTVKKNNIVFIHKQSGDKFIFSFDGKGDIRTVDLTKIESEADADAEEDGPKTEIEINLHPNDSKYYDSLPTIRVKVEEKTIELKVGFSNVLYETKDRPYGILLSPPI